jgi:endonuclease/exonuclease/phosphatase (EEP) superfamily protein YafD
MRGYLGAAAFCLAATLDLATLAGYADYFGPAMEVLANFRLHLAVMAGALGVISGLARLWRSAGLALLTALIAVAGLGPVFETAQYPGTPPSEGDHVLTLLYANLRATNPDPASLKAMLRRVDADILITSETTRPMVEGPDGLRATYPYRFIRTGPGAVMRTGIWSKFPLRDGELFLNNTVAPTAAASSADLGGGLMLGLIGAHFSRPFEPVQKRQFESLGPIAEKLARPLIVAGDFNAAPWSWAVTRAAEVTGTRVLGGYRVTWKGDYPTPLGPVPELWGHQIDNLLLSEEIGVETVETLFLPGSDHLGVFVRLRIPGP